MVLRAAMAGTRVDDSATGRDGMFARDSRRRREWVLWIGGGPAHDEFDGWMGRAGKPGPSRSADRRFLAGWQAGRDRRKRGPLERYGSRRHLPVRKFWWWFRRSRDRAVRSRSGSRPVPQAVPPCRCWPTMVRRGAPPRAVAEPREQTASAPPRAMPALERFFHTMVRDGDAGSSSNYTAVRGVLKGVGREVQVYVAAEDVEHVSSTLVRDLIVTFDDRIYPLRRSRVGTARDVDGDGRFTILLSSWLDHLGGGRYPVDGFVRVADLDPAYRPPFGNQCDMMYLNALLKAGPHLRTVVAHEYMHAVLFSQKTLRRAPRSANRSGRGRLAGRSARPPCRRPEWVFHVEHRLSRQCVLDVSGRLPARGG